MKCTENRSLPWTMKLPVWRGHSSYDLSKVSSSEPLTLRGVIGCVWRPELNSEISLHFWGLRSPPKHSPQTLSTGHHPQRVKKNNNNEWSSKPFVHCVRLITSWRCSIAFWLSEVNLSFFFYFALGFEAYTSAVAVVSLGLMCSNSRHVSGSSLLKESVCLGWIRRNIISPGMVGSIKCGWVRGKYCYLKLNSSSAAALSRRLWWLWVASGVLKGFASNHSGVVKGIHYLAW